MPYINLGDNRNESYDLSVKSWKQWCDKNDVDLFVWDELVFPIERMKITWQRYYLFDILESNEIDYNQVLMVDADTIIHPDTPNFFEETENKYCGVINDGCYEWVSRSIKKYGDYIFPDDTKLKPWNYINGGFQIVNKNHKQLFQDIIKFYWENSDKLLYAQKEFKVGTIYFLSLLSSHRGIHKIYDHHPEVKIFTGSVEPEMNDQDYLIPGVGDAGDRLYGTM